MDKQRTKVRNYFSPVPVVLFLGALCTASVGLACEGERQIRTFQEIEGELQEIDLGGDMPGNILFRCPSSVGDSTLLQLRNFLSSLAGTIDQQRRLRRAGQTGYPTHGAASGDSIGDYGRLSTFASADYNNVDRSRTTLGQGLTQDSFSFTWGADYRLRDTLFLGGTLNLLSSDTDIDDNLGSTDVNTIVMGFHGSQYWQNDLFLDWLATLSYSDLDIDRTDLAGSYKASTDAWHWSTELSFGHQLSVSRWRITPIARLFYMRGQLDGYTERVVSQFGDPEVADKQSHNLTMFDLSLQTDYVLLANWGVVIPSFKLAYERDFSGTSSSSGRVLTTQETLHIFYSGETDDPDRNTVMARLGVSAQFQRGLSAFINYQHLLGHDYFDRYHIGAGIRYEIPLGFAGF